MPLLVQKSSNPPRKIILLSSGASSNAKKIVDISLRLHHRLNVVALGSDREDCPLIEKNFASQIPKIFLPPIISGIDLDPILKKEKYDELIATHLRPFKADWLILAGFMRIIGPKTLNLFKQKNRPQYNVINLHPSLLPEFKGLKALERSFQVKSHMGLTIHYVDELLDHGTIIKSIPVKGLRSETLDEYQKRHKRIENWAMENVAREIAFLGEPKKEDFSHAMF